MLLAGLRDPGAEIVRSLGLPAAGNVVKLAFDGEQRGLADGGGLDLAMAAANKARASALNSFARPASTFW